jgi:hypothetical protein
VAAAGDSVTRGRGDPSASMRARRAGGRSWQLVLKLEEWISDLEVAQRKGEAELIQLGARYGRDTGEIGAARGELREGPGAGRGGGRQGQVSRDRCLRAIVDLLGEGTAVLSGVLR